MAEAASLINTVMFADIQDSTRLYEVLGDETAARLVTGGVEAMVQQIARTGGVVVKTLGDGVLCRFSTPHDAVAAVRAIMTGHDNRIRIKIGLDHGNVLLDDTGDIFGDVVNCAARISGLARASETLASGAVVDAFGIQPPGGIRFEPLKRVTLRGRQEPVDLFFLSDPTLREQEEAVEADETESPTIFMDPSEVAAAQPQAQFARLRVILDYQGEMAELSVDNPRILLGRSEHCDVTVRCHNTSREHATMSLERGRLSIKDHSRNGTYVILPGRRISLIREMMDLPDVGVVSLGQDETEGEAALVGFKTFGR